MSISGISGGSGSIWESYRQACASGGMTKSSLTQLQSQLKEEEKESAASKVGELLSAFDQIDTDQSAEVDLSEMETYMREMGLRTPGGPPRGGEAPELTKEQLSEMAEKSGDSGLAAVVNSFDQADTNSDGLLSQAEFESFAEANGIERPKGPPPGGPPPPSSESEEEDESETEDETAEWDEVKDISAQMLAKLLQQYAGLSYSDALGASLWEGTAA